MVMVGNFCLVDPFFPGDSFMFNESDLNKLKKGYHISTYREEVSQYQGRDTKVAGVESPPWQVLPGHNTSPTA